TIEAPAEMSWTLIPRSATARNTRAATPWAYPRPSPTKLIRDTCARTSIRSMRPGGRRANVFFARLTPSASTRSATHVCDVAALYTFVPASVRAVETSARRLSLRPAPVEKTLRVARSRTYEMLFTSPLRSTVSGPMRVPVSSGLKMFFRTTEAPHARAGCTDRGWRAFAPQEDSSGASASESADRGNASGARVGSALMDRPTSHEISRVGGSSAYANTGAV